jgi:sugar phosphate isomerase/epimerase
MIYSGLVSISFRKLSPKEILELCTKAGLEGIEWGGDIHVPHGDVSKAKEVCKMTEAAGLKTAAYGSYYYVGHEKELSFSFDQVLESAVALNTPTIRVWAGKRPSAQADDAWWNNVKEESRIIADKAFKANIKISYEYHRNTLTDTPDAADRLIKNVMHDNIYSYWQPAIDLSKEERLLSLQRIAPWLTNLHVYQWQDTQRLPLRDGIGDWQNYFGYANTLAGNRYAMLEFVKDDSPEQLLEDAATLKSLLSFR